MGVATTAGLATALCCHSVRHVREDVWVPSCGPRDARDSSHRSPHLSPNQSPSLSQMIWASCIYSNLDGDGGGVKRDRRNK